MTAKNIFLIDGFGALITAGLLSQVLARFEDFFGMPKPTIWALAFIALGFAFYSFSAFSAQFFSRSAYRKLLKGIIFGNIAYCLLTGVLVFYHFSSLTVFGLLYFGGEITVVLALVKKEFDLVKQNQRI